MAAFIRPVAITKFVLGRRLIHKSSVCTNNSTADEPTKKPRLYTKTGDKGTSGLFTGERRPKDDKRFEALGATDELSSAIGLAREFITDAQIDDQLEHIQCCLQDLQSVIATPKTSARDAHLLKVAWNDGHLKDVEEWTDSLTQELPVLKNFILPSGGKASASLHVARAVCRRAERRLVPLASTEDLEIGALQFLNRLSSYLFMAARACAEKDGKQEKIYKRPQSLRTDRN
jgi:cob(I)alamin adenosyltransferase